MSTIIIESILALTSLIIYILSKDSEWLIFVGIALIIMSLERLINVVEDLIANDDTDWISVKTALPPEPERNGHYWPEYNVIIKGASVATTLEYRGAGVWMEPQGSIPYTIEYWQPLPEPPEGELE